MDRASRGGIKSTRFRRVHGLMPRPREEQYLGDIWPMQMSPTPVSGMSHRWSYAQAVHTFACGLSQILVSSQFYRFKQMRLDDYVAARALRSIGLF